LTTCPVCGSTHTYKDGLRYTRLQQTQRYLCRLCGYRFSGQASTQSGQKDIIFNRHTSVCRVSVSDSESKNLTAEQPIKVESAGATKPIEETVFQFKWYLKKQGRAKTTITSQGKLLKLIIEKGANLHDPETVKEVIACQDTWSEGRKENAVYVYSNYLNMIGGTWNPPRYKRIRKLPWIPSEEEIDQLVAGSSNRIATFLQLLKETGIRSGEAWQTQWTDIEFQNRTIRITPEKGSNPRIFQISSMLLGMLNNLQRKNEYIFQNGALRHFAGNYRKQRKRLAFKFGNPRLNRISFRTLRHFKATKEYNRTGDILHVMKVLGHKNIKNTLVYTQLANFKDHDYISKVAQTAEEAKGLIESGFEYVCTTPDRCMIFRKPK
jgi:integrase